MGTDREHPTKIRFKRAFRLYVGKGTDPAGDERIAVTELAMMTGQCRKTIESHYDKNGNCPNLEAMDLYMKVLPLGFSALYLFPTGFVIAAAPEHELPSTPEFQAEQANNMHRIAVQLCDGIHSPKEKRDAAPGLIELGAKALAIGHDWQNAEGCEVFKAAE